MVGHDAFVDYKKNNHTIPPSLEEQIRNAYKKIRDNNPKRGAYIGRGYHVPDIEAPNGPRTAA